MEKEIGIVVIGNNIENDTGLAALFRKANQEGLKIVKNSLIIEEYQKNSDVGKNFKCKVHMEYKPEYKVKSVCCNANVFPDGIAKQLVCEKCGENLGDSPWNNEKIISEEKMKINSLKSYYIIGNYFTKFRVLSPYLLWMRLAYWIKYGKR